MRSQERKSGLYNTRSRDIFQNNGCLLHSKSELKKRIKQREQEERKASKQAAHPLAQAQSSKTPSAEDAEAELTPNVCKHKASSLLRMLMDSSNILKYDAGKSESFKPPGRSTHTLTNSE